MTITELIRKLQSIASDSPDAEVFFREPWDDPSEHAVNSVTVYGGDVILALDDSPIEL